MKTNWRYDILFNFRFYYTKELKPGTFVIVPSKECSNTLKKHNLIFKSTENGAMIISEKHIISESNCEAVWKLNQTKAFTFILVLKDLMLFPNISPYSSNPEDKLPDYYGKTRILYFDNLDMDNKIDNLTNPTTKSLNIAKNETVGIEDLASVIPNKLAFRKTNGISQVNLKPVKPGSNQNLEFQLTDQKPIANVSLETGAYELELIGSGKPKETIFVGSELSGSSVFGIIQIYKDQTIDYNTSIQYEIHFKEP